MDQIKYAQRNKDLGTKKEGRHLGLIPPVEVQTMHFLKMSDWQKKGTKRVLMDNKKDPSDLKSKSKTCISKKQMNLPEDQVSDVA